MKLITSWLKVNQSFGAVIAISAAFCALLALGKPPSTNSTISAAAKQTAPKIVAPSLPKVALATADSPDWVAEVQSKLVATGRFSQVDTINAGSTTPTLAQLLGYKSVLVW